MDISLVSPLSSHFKIDPGGNVLACDHHRELPRSGGWFDCVSTTPTCIFKVIIRLICAFFLLHKSGVSPSLSNAMDILVLSS